MAEAKFYANLHEKHNFSKQHLRAAEFFAAEAQALEATTPDPDEP